MPEDFEQMWSTIAPIGRSSRTGGYLRQPWTTADSELRTWFVAEAEARGLAVEGDGNGNLLATWVPEDAHVVTGEPLRVPEGRSPVSKGAVLVGSHLDSVLDGGAYDGPLGVVSSFAAIDRLRERGVEPGRPVMVGAFADEEGSRFGLACLGSRLATGATTRQKAAELRDRDGVFLPDAMVSAGFEPALGPAEWVDRVGCFVELHVEQGRDLVDRDVPVGLASAIWPHGRYRFEFAGEANHAGTTRMEDRHDPMLSYAMTALAAAKQARLAGQRATFGRLDVAPNGTNAIPSRVTAWLDARCDTEEALASLVGEIERLGSERTGRDGTSLAVTAESVSAAVSFDRDLTARLDRALGGGIPVIPTMAGHDAGILASAGVPTAMMFVRNPTGVSHSPDEFASTEDCLAGVDALATVLSELVS